MGKLPDNYFDPIIEGRFKARKAALQASAEEKEIKKPKKRIRAEREDNDEFGENHDVWDEDNEYYLVAIGLEQRIQVLEEHLEAVRGFKTQSNVNVSDIGSIHTRLKKLEDAVEAIIGQMYRYKENFDTAQDWFMNLEQKIDRQNQVFEVIEGTLKNLSTLMNATREEDM